MLANAEFDSERNHQHVRDVVGDEGTIPSKRGKRDWRPDAVRAQLRTAFPREHYR